MSALILSHLNGLSYTVEVKRKEWKLATTFPRSIILTCSSGWACGHYHQVTRDMDGSFSLRHLVPDLQARDGS